MKLLLIPLCVALALFSRCERALLVGPPTLDSSALTSLPHCPALHSSEHQGEDHLLAVLGTFEACCEESEREETDLPGLPAPPSPLS